MILKQLQALLVRLYDVPECCAVDDYLVSAREYLATTNSASGAVNADEQVLVKQKRGELKIGVYIADDVLQRLSIDNPLLALSDRNLADFCTALEGVSHFHYLTWAATRARRVSLLELELQAEVDKYAAGMFLLTAQHAGKFPQTLHERLFHCVRFYAGLDADSVLRYQTANLYAARFCRRLDERFLKPRRVRAEAWLRELRNFYRLSHVQKLYCVNA